MRHNLIDELTRSPRALIDLIGGLGIVVLTAILILPVLVFGAAITVVVLHLIGAAVIALLIIGIPIAAVLAIGGAIEDQLKPPLKPMSQAEYDAFIKSITP